MCYGRVLRFCCGESGMWKIERKETIMVFWGGEIVYVKHSASNKSSHKLLHQGRQTTGTQLYILHFHPWLCLLHKPATGTCCCQHCVWIQITGSRRNESLKSRNYWKTVRKNVFLLMQKTVQLIKQRKCSNVNYYDSTLHIHVCSNCLWRAVFFWLGNLQVTKMILCPLERPECLLFLQYTLSAYFPLEAILSKKLKSI